MSVWDGSTTSLAAWRAPVKPRPFGVGAGFVDAGLQSNTNQLSNKIAQKGLALLRQRSITMVVIASEQARQDLAPPAFGYCGAAAMGRDGCPATTEILMTKAKAKQPATTR